MKTVMSETDLMLNLAMMLQEGRSLDERIELAWKIQQAYGVLFRRCQQEDRCVTNKAEIHPQ